MVYTYMSVREVSKVNPIESREEKSRLLELRAALKQRTPRFQRQESWRYARIHDPWRKPKGVDSHMRLSVKGWPALVKIGYRGPQEVRGLHPSGYRDVLVSNVSELNQLVPNQDAARIRAGVGRRKRIEIAKRAKELGIRVLNGRGLLFGVKTAEDSEEVNEEKEKKESPPKETKKKPSKKSIPKKSKSKAKKKE